MEHRFWRFARRFVFGLAAVSFIAAADAGVRPAERAEAHPYSAAYTTLELSGTAVRMTYSIDELSVMELTGGDRDGNGMLDEDEFDAAKETLVEVLRGHVALRIGGLPQSWTAVETIEMERKGSDTRARVVVLFPPAGDDPVFSLEDRLYDDDPNTRYVNLLTVRYGANYSTAALSGDNRTWAMRLAEEELAELPAVLPPPMADAPAEGSANEASASGNEASVSGNEGGIAPNDRGAYAEGRASAKAGPMPGVRLSEAWSFFLLGVQHIVGGYDHLLFLFSILIPKQSFRQYAAAITAFTAAHCLTLVLTVLGLIDLSPRFVEPLIALSICWVAAANLVRGKPSAGRCLPIFGFGLIHGMGFADLLKEMPIPETGLAVALLGFNIGIEAVQLAIASLLWPLLALLHRWRFSPQTVMAGSAIALLLGGAWLIERVQV